MVVRACFVILLTGTLAASLAAQGRSSVDTSPPEQPLAFDVASVRQSPADARGAMISGPAPSQFTTRNATLVRLVAYAYGVPAAQVVGGPGWGTTVGFDIAATYPEGWVRGRDTRDVPRMLQVLLAERFRLRVHTATRQDETYDLVLARRDRRLGPKLRPTQTDCQAYRAELKASGRTVSFGPDDVPMCMMLGMPLRIISGGWTIAGLASMLATRVGRPVADRAELTGEFDFELEWSADQPTQAVAGATGPVPVGPDDNLSIFTALQEQLGLKLESARGPVEVVEVDAAELPTPN